MSSIRNKCKITIAPVLKEEQKIGKSYVLYWMQAAQRDNYNPALELAIDKANELALPLLILFCIDDSFPEANLRHYQFMLEGLWEVGQRLQERRIPLLFALGEAEDIIVKLSSDIATVIFDKGYLRWQKHSRENVHRQLNSLGIPCFEMETEVIVPVEIISSKEEYSAATLRSKMMKILPEYLNVHIPCTPLTPPAKTALLPKPAPENDFRYAEQMACAEELVSWARTGLSLDESVTPVNNIRGGFRAAASKLDTFISDALPLYATLHSDPSTDYQSGLSPYLHFGQISPLEIAQRIIAESGLKPFDVPDLIRHKATLSGAKAQSATFLEQLIVRRELSMNFCHFNPDYDSYNSIPLWARESLDKHRKDKRTYLYSSDNLENAETHDPFWNAAQSEMLETGTMHNYMRMYWGKKIIEWTPDPDTAFYLMQYLNNRYELDGRDPNAFAGIAWCFGKHDRPWKTRPIFGSVRYMNAMGLLRKFNMDAYLKRIEHALNSSG